MNPQQIKQARADFWEHKAPQDRKHAHLPAASLIVNAADDPTTLFNSAWMQQVVPYLMGKKHPSWDKLYNIQWCVRTWDLDEVWDASHLSYFEMMGNRSLWSYFKKESITWSWEFLTQVLKLDPKKIAVTVFEWDDNAPRDEESATHWKEQWVPDSLISYLWVKDNRWGPAGATGPCGPDTEIFYWIWDSEYPPESSNVREDEDNWMEIWNNVFMAYNKDADGNYTELQQKNVDTWMWFERISLVMQSIAEWRDIREMSVYDTWMFRELLHTLSQKSLIEYSAAVWTQLRDFRVIADHCRAAAMLIAEWLTPSNEWRWYVLRKLIRRMYFHCTNLLWDRLSTSQDRKNLCSEFLQWYASQYERLKREYDRVVTVLIQEVEWFVRTLDQWTKKLTEMLEWFQQLTWEQAFTLYDTYWLPLEVTSEIAWKAWVQVDKDWFDTAMEAARERSRSWWWKFSKTTDRASFVDWLPETQFVGYDEHVAESTLLKDDTIDWMRVLVFDTTPFYAESWGQRGDYWTITLDDGSAVNVVDTQAYGWVQLHIVE